MPGPDPERWWIVGLMGQAVRPLADPTAPHSHIDKPGGELKRLRNPGLQLGEISLKLLIENTHGGEAAVGETPSLTGEFIGEAQRGLEPAKAHPLRNQH